jgi:CheY-like chemotaxis protein
MDGIEALRVIREEIGTTYAKTVPVIALTANAIVGNENMFLEKGFQEFLSKPIDILRLDGVINRWVRDKRKEKEPAGRLETPENAAGTPAPGNKKLRQRRVEGLDFENGLRRFGGDEEIYWDVLKSFALNTPPLLDGISGCAPDDLPGYAITVHGIKGSGQGIGAETVRLQAEALEFAAKKNDFAFVAAHNGAFIQETRKLIAALSALLQSVEAETPRPEKAEPEGAVLDALLEACAVYDIDGVDKAMTALESCAYASGAELVLWLREQVKVLGFKQIRERLEQRTAQAGKEL